MADELRKTTITFSRPVRFPCGNRVLPAGVYWIEWRQRRRDGAETPQAPETEVLLRLGAEPGAETLTVQWGALCAALAGDQPCAGRSRKQPVDELLADPLVRLVMSSDGVTDHTLRRSLRAARLGRMGRTALGGRLRVGRPQVSGHAPGLDERGVRAPEARG